MYESYLGEEWIGWTWTSSWLPRTDACWQQNRAGIWSFKWDFPSGFKSISKFKTPGINVNKGRKDPERLQRSSIDALASRTLGRQHYSDTETRNLLEHQEDSRDWSGETMGLAPSWKLLGAGQCPQTDLRSIISTFKPIQHELSSFRKIPKEETTMEERNRTRLFVAMVPEMVPGRS